MARATTRRWLLGAMVAAGVGLGGCLSPTLPLPPPGQPDVSPIDQNGMVTLTAGAGSVEGGALVGSFNQNGGHGVIETATAAGAYKIVIAAQPGDDIAVWQEVGNERSASIIVTIKANEKK